MPRTAIAQPADGEIRIRITRDEHVRLAALTAAGVPTEQAAQVVLEGPRWAAIKRAEQLAGDLVVDLQVEGAA